MFLCIGCLRSLICFSPVIEGPLSETLSSSRGFVSTAAVGICIPLFVSGRFSFDLECFLFSVCNVLYADDENFCSGSLCRCFRGYGASKDSNCHSYCDIFVGVPRVPLT